MFNKKKINYFSTLLVLLISIMVFVIYQIISCLFYYYVTSSFVLQYLFYCVLVMILLFGTFNYKDKMIDKFKLNNILFYISFLIGCIIVIVYSIYNGFYFINVEPYYQLILLMIYIFMFIIVFLFSLSETIEKNMKSSFFKQAITILLRIVSSLMFLILVLIFLIFSQQKSLIFSQQKSPVYSLVIFF